MRHSKGLVWLVLGILLFTVTVEAAEQESGSKVGRFFRALFKFPAKTTEKSVGVATEAAKSGAAIGTGEIENVGEALTGSKEAVVGIVKEPVMGAAETSVEAAKGAVMAPIEGAQEAVKEHPGN